MKRLFGFILMITSFFSYSFEFLTDFYDSLNEKGTRYFSEDVSNSDFNYYLHLIEYGSADAIKLSPQALKYTNTSTTLAVYNALARGLLKNPKAVLSLPNAIEQINDLCTVPFFDAPIDVETIHIALAMKVLKENVWQDGQAEKNRIACLAVFERIASKAQ